MSDTYVHTMSLMGTVVTMQVVGHGATSEQQRERSDAITRAFGWFHHVEAICSRFDAASELRQLSSHIGEPVVASPLLYHVLEFALAVAEESDGAFDPTVGRRMELLGFNHEYRSGVEVDTSDALTAVSYRDVTLDQTARTITLTRPLLLDLGAVAKGLAIDMAVRELQPFENFAIDAGGDLFLGGHNTHDEPWRVGIRHPRDATSMIEHVRVSNVAVCTSGDYERRTPGSSVVSAHANSHHVLDARAGASAELLASVTVIANSAMVADALATAAFALGPTAGVALLTRHGVDALLVTPSLERVSVGQVHHA